MAPSIYISTSMNFYACTGWLGAVFGEEEKREKMNGFVFDLYPGIYFDKLNKDFVIVYPKINWHDINIVDRWRAKARPQENLLGIYKQNWCTYGALFAGMTSDTTTVVYGPDYDYASILQYR